MDYEQDADDRVRVPLEAFPDRIKRRDTVGVRVDGQASVNQMKAIDMVYEKVSLPVRPTSTYIEDTQGLER